MKWSLQKHSFSLTIEVPEGTSGVVSVPVAGKVSVNGKAQSESGATLHLAGGKHIVSVSV